MTDFTNQMQEDDILKLILEYLNDIDFIVQLFKFQYGNIFDADTLIKSEAEIKEERQQQYVENRRSHEIKPSRWKYNLPTGRWIKVSPWEIMLLSSSTDYCCSICCKYLSNHNLVNNNDILCKDIVPTYLPEFARNIIFAKGGYVDSHDVNYSMVCGGCVWKYKLKFTLLKLSQKELEILRRQMYRCDDCKTLISPAFEIDHIIPKSEGGNAKSLDNLHALCSNCHAMKSQHEKVVHGKTGYITCNSQFANNLAKRWIERVKDLK